MRIMTFTALLLLTCLAPAQAKQDVPSQDQVSAFLLTTLYSEHGESTDQFISRSADVIFNYTRQKGYEVCGNIYTSTDDDSETMTLPLITSISAVGCISKNVSIPGFERTPETVHTHPLLKTVVINRQDAIFWNKNEGDVLSIHPQNKYFFSDGDFNSGPGYLVIPDRIIHQNGRDNVRVVQ